MGVKSKRFKNWTISYLNEAELDEMLKELYEKKYYQLDIAKSDPVIFDVGALIGETVLYFKDLYPRSKIIAFEPSPRSFKLLKKNVTQNRLSSVKLINFAVGANKGLMAFYTDKNPKNPWGRGDSLKQNRFNNKLLSKVVKVSTVKLSGYINKPVDLLKLDVEGSETEVIQEIEPKLHFINQLILEYHYNAFVPQNKLSLILEIFRRHGFHNKAFVSRWQFPLFGVKILLALLPLLKAKEFWVRIYAKQHSPGR